MKTIEERAKEYACKQAGGHYEGGIEGLVYDSSKEAYIQIATEQEAITVEKVWNVLFSHFNSDLPFDKEWLIKALEEYDMKNNTTFITRKGWGICAKYNDGTLSTYRYGKTKQEAENKVKNSVKEYYGK